MPKKTEVKKEEKKCVNGKCTVPPKKDVKKGGGCGCAGTPMN